MQFKYDHSHIYIYIYTYPFASFKSPTTYSLLTSCCFIFIFFTLLGPISAAYMCVGVGHPSDRGKPTSGRILKEGLFSSHQQFSKGRGLQITYLST